MHSPLQFTMRLLITTRKKHPVADEVLYGLFRESFQQWTDKGIVAKFLEQDFGYFKEAIKNAAIILAIDEDRHEPVGMMCVKCYKDMHAFDFYLAVAPRARHQGVATRMLDFVEGRLRERGYRYICDTTSVQASWSVNWHLKNGYRIVGYGQGKQPYTSTYKLRKQLAPLSLRQPSTWLWNAPLAPLTARLSYLAWRAAQRVRSFVH